MRRKCEKNPKHVHRVILYNIFQVTYICAYPIIVYPNASKIISKGIVIIIFSIMSRKLLSNCPKPDISRLKLCSSPGTWHINKCNWCTKKYVLTMRCSPILNYAIFMWGLKNIDFNVWQCFKKLKTSYLRCILTMFFKTFIKDEISNKFFKCKTNKEIVES